MNSRLINIIRWVARIWAALMVAFMLFMFGAHIVDDGLGLPFNLTARDGLMMASMFILVLGLALAWKWEKLGGWMTVLGLVAFYLFDYLFTGDFPRGTVFHIIAFPGILFLIAAYAKEKPASAE